MKKFSVGSMFAGVGGICCAFKQADYHIAWANEYDAHACNTYRHNFPNTHLIEQDICTVPADTDLKVDVITSGFPCQAFSVAGYRKGFADDRGNLFFETARFIDALKPQAYLIENVKNLVGHDDGKTLKIIRNTLVNDLGYSFIPFVLNAKEYGNIPQTRERIYIVGFKNESKGGDKSTFFEIPKPIPRNTTIHHMYAPETVQERHYYTPSNKAYPMLKKHILSQDTIYQYRRVYVRDNKSKVCPTLTANMGTGGHNVPIILTPQGIRKLTPKECFNFQGFPQDFSFPDNMAQSHLYKQAGNSVVVPVVHRIASEIKRVLESY